MKILLINNQFAIGGAARVAAVQCNQFINKGVDLYVATDYENWPMSYELDNRIKLLPLQLNAKKDNNIQKVKKAFCCIRDIRRYINEVKPDVVICIQSDMYLRTYIANRGLNYPIIVADHTSFARQQGFVTNYTRFKLYKKADGLSVLTQKDAKLLVNSCSVKKVIYNPLSLKIFNHENERRKTVLCVGRLDVWKLKGFDTILKIWKDIVTDHPGWNLEIAGSGNYKNTEYLKNLIKELNIENDVRMLGQIQDMRLLYQSTSIFALPSRMEGFPMGLLEAMSQACACVAFSVDRAVDEMMPNDAGILIPDGDVQGFKDALNKIIEDETIRIELGKKAIIASKHFSPEQFADEWMQLIDDTIKHYSK